MPLSRNTRMDRRKKLILESAENAREFSRDRRPSRSSRTDDEEIAVAGLIRRDAGYSHSVRHACQFRLSQLIPVRRSSLAIFIASVWTIWGLLLGAHYLLFVRPEIAVDRPPIAYLFYLRSYYSISQWLGTQLWFMTALAALFIYLLRRHKLDDYRAKYRLWLILIAAALFASLDSTTSSLKLLGDSIDSWSRTEVGYSGRALVLASFASMIGVLGLRLCGELRAAPTSVGFWLAGLIAWGISALFGTELLVLSWRPAVLDMFVGGLWLGGVLAVWLSASIYLRHTYIHAQKRMVARAGMLQPIQFKMPKLRWPQRDQQAVDDQDESHDGGERVDENSMKRGLSALTSIFRRQNRDLNESDESEKQEKKRWLGWKRRVASEEIDRDENDREPVQKSRLASSIPVKSEMNSARNDAVSVTSAATSVHERSNRNAAGSGNRTGGNGEEEKSVAAKRRWWPQVFQRKGASIDDPSADASSSVGTAKAKKIAEARPTDSRTGDTRTGDTRTGEPKSTEGKKEVRESNGTQRRSLSSRIPWFKRKESGDESTAKKSNEGTPKKKSEERVQHGDEQPSTKVSWFNRFGRSKSSIKNSDENGTKPSTVKSEPKAAKAKPIPVKSEPSTTAEGKRKGLFSFMDGLKLKPPVEESTQSGSPSHSQARPKPVSASEPLPSTIPIDEEDDSDDRNMTRAERKRMRREQMNQRRAA